MARRGLQEVVPDLKKQLETDWNVFIKQVAADLATDVNNGGVSPTYTGFFASSWNASLTPNSPTDRIQDYPSWYKIKKQKDKGIPTKAEIKPRYTVGTFKVFNTVFIGNKAEYASYALEKPSVATYVQGKLRKLIQDTFKEGQTVSVGFRGQTYSQGGS